MTRANDAHLATAMARAGIGRVVLPTFVGDAAQTLLPLGPPIEALDSE